MNGAKQVWKNMMEGKYYIKGERDSTTKQSVLAARIGNHFDKANCYWAMVAELPKGTYYIDGERDK